MLLRGINVGSANRIAMPALREALADAGFAKVRTYVQSGNIVVETGLDDEKLSDAVERLIADQFGLSVPALARGHAELAAVVSANPYPEQALQDPKRFQVSFSNLSSMPDTTFGVVTSDHCAFPGSMRSGE